MCWVESYHLTDVGGGAVMPDLERRPPNLFKGVAIMARTLNKRYCDICGNYYEGRSKFVCGYSCAREKQARAKHPNVDFSKEAFEELYIRRKLSMPLIAQELAVSIDLVRRRLIRYGIPIRSARSAALLTLSEGRGRQKSLRITDARGYVMAYAPDHHKPDGHGYVREHRLVWERHSGQELPDKWIVHHLNGVKDDNRIENLLAMHTKDHHSWMYIEALQKRIRGLEEKLDEWSPIALASIKKAPERLE